MKLIEKRIPLMEECFQGDNLELILERDCVDKWFISKGVENFSNFRLSVYREKNFDFGGPIFYFVPKDKAEEVEATLIQWIESQDKIEDISVVHQFDSFYPQFEDCMMGNNW